MLSFKHILIMPAQLGIQIGIRNSKVNCKLSKTDVLDTVSSQIKEVTLERKTLKKLTDSRFLKDLINTFVLTLLNFLRKLALYIFMICIYRQSGQNQNQANTRSSVLKLKHPFRNTCPGQKNQSYQQICQQNCNVLEVMSVSV